MHKIYCVDLDGSILNDFGKINKKDLNIIKVILNNDYLVIATGRRYKMILTLLKNFSDYNLNNLFIISSEGQLIHKGNGKLIYKQKYFLTSEIHKIFNNQSLFHLYSENCDYFFEKNICKRVILNINSFIKNKSKNKKYISKKEIINTDWNICKIDKIRSSSINKGLENKFNIHVFSDKYFELTQLNCNKYYALNWLSKQLNVNNDYIVALGNDANDLSLAENVKYFYAVQNATDEIKDMAYYVLKETNNDSPLSCMYMHYKNI